MANPWYSQVLREHASALTRYIGKPEWMPEFNDGMKLGHYGVLAEKPLGCGHFGCVMKTYDPNVVFKITSDPSEATFVASAAKVMGNTPWPIGIVKYYGVVRIPDRLHKNRKVYAIWRERANEVGGLVKPAFGGWKGRLFDMNGASTDAYAKREINRQIDLLTLALRSGGVIRTTLNSAAKRNPSFAIKMMEGACREYNRTGHAVDLDEYLGWDYSATKHRFDVGIKHYRGEMRVARCMQIFYSTAETMANTPYMTEVGDAFQALMDHGIILADVHLGNIGLVEREDEGYDDPIVAITDPGHMIAMCGVETLEPDVLR